MSFLASYPGTCAECSGRIKPGELIEQTPPGGWAYSHVECPEVAELAAPASTPLCPSCFIYHRGECL